MIEVGAIASENTNLVTGAKPYGASAADDTMSMSFDDFIDMINPLEHIPVVSSIYRAVTGDTINPVARIAGDVLYGGILGPVSAGLSALGAISDETITAANDGKSVASTVVAALFGSDDDKTTQVASAAESAQTVSPQQVEPTTIPAVLQTLASQSPILEYPDLTQASSATPALVAPAVPAQAVASNDDNQTEQPSGIPLVRADTNKGLSLDRAKPAYGGVMDTAMLQSAQQNQALALALSGKNGALQAQHNMRNSRFAVGDPSAAILPPSNSAPTSSPLSAMSVQTPIAPQTQTAMQDLLKELQLSRSINQYKNAAQNTPQNGTTLDVAN